MQPVASQKQSVESLAERIRELVAERQALRTNEGDISALERNRLEIAHLQQQLSHALIERHRPAA
jgi:hypothetical protein